MALFEWGVAFHDLDFEAIRKGEKSKEEVREELKGIAGKARTPDRQGLRRLPRSRARHGRVAAASRRSPRREAGAAARCGACAARRRSDLDRSPTPSSRVQAPYRSTLWADVTANVVRNFWSNAIIFCGHFPDQTYTFSAGGGRGRDARAAGTCASCSAPRTSRAAPLFHVARGNLGYQVEHHLYPDMPSTRYGEIAPKVRDVCKRYGLPYNTGPFGKQWRSVQRTILRLAFPGGKPRPKPGPYRGADTEDVPPPQARSNGKPPEGSAPQEGSNGGPAATRERRRRGSGRVSGYRLSLRAASPGPA